LFYLRKNGVKTKVYFFKYAHHGIMSFSMKGGLPAGQFFGRTVRNHIGLHAGIPIPKK